MKEKIERKTVLSCCVIFTILIVVHGFEAIVLRMDETVFGENCINKLFGILAVFLVLRLIGWKWEDIGFAKSGFVKGIFTGFALAAVSFAISYTVEIILLRNQGLETNLGVFTTGFSLTGEAAVHTGIGFILMCVFFNIINVIMEEGTFRGLFYGIVGTDHSMRFSLLFQAFLFGIWHIVTPLHNLIDGDINMVSFAVLGVGYIILAGMMGIKWALLYRMTGNLYAGMADHFFNNCIATNLLHVVTDTGIDEMMIVRVLIAQLLSFAAVFAVWLKHPARFGDRQAEKADPSKCIIPVNGGTIQKVTDMKAGEIVTFGRYAQDADPSNDPKKIEWIVLGVEEHRALLLSRYVLDGLSFNESQKYIPWKKCTLRKWLNMEFYTVAFTEEERSLIPETKLKVEEFIYIIKPRNVDTTDRIFLLGDEEMGKYYGDQLEIGKKGSYQGSSPDLIAEATPYALTQGVKSYIISESHYNAMLADKNYSTDVIGREGVKWWMRKNTDGWKTVDIVSYTGDVGCGMYVCANDIGVRPALYVSW